MMNYEAPRKQGTNVIGCHMILTSRFQSQCFAEFWWSCSFEKACLDMKGFHRQRNLREYFFRASFELCTTRMVTKAKGALIAFYMETMFNK